LTVGNCQGAPRREGVESLCLPQGLLTFILVLDGASRFQVRVQDKHELHEIMNMIASAMQIMNMIVSAMGPFSAKASAEASIFARAPCARTTRCTRRAHARSSKRRPKRSRNAQKRSSSLPLSRGRRAKRGEKENERHHGSTQQQNTTSTYQLIPHREFPTVVPD
jgi:hypothetical protein